MDSSDTRSEGDAPMGQVYITGRQLNPKSSTRLKVCICSTTNPELECEHAGEIRTQFAVECDPAICPYVGETGTWSCFDHWFHSGGGSRRCQSRLFY